jgi:hypothetical protein
MGGSPKRAKAEKEIESAASENFRAKKRRSREEAESAKNSAAVESGDKQACYADKILHPLNQAMNCLLSA